jgi:hypothetical protein
MLIVLGNHSLLFMSQNHQFEPSLMTILFHFEAIESPFGRIMEILRQKNRPDWI